MERVTEPHELMEDLAQAKDYADSDFSEPHDAFIARFQERFPEFSEGLVLDIGCGNADPTIRFAKKYPQAKLIGLDGSEAMLSFAKLAIEKERLSHRIQLDNRLLQDDTYSPATFDAIICNSLLHQLENPLDLWGAIRKVAKPGAPILVMDLMRPQTESDASKLVELHANGAPPLMARDFYNSLLAAFRPDEVRSQLDASGLSDLQVEVVSDRHMLIHGKAPSS